MSQVETANVIILNKIEMIKEKKGVQRLKKIARAFNPSARIFEASYGNVGLVHLIDTNLFSSITRTASIQPLEGTALDDFVEDADTTAKSFYGISSFVYKVLDAC